MLVLPNLCLPHVDFLTHSVLYTVKFRSPQEETFFANFEGKIENNAKVIGVTVTRKDTMSKNLCF